MGTTRVLTPRGVGAVAVLAFDEHALQADAARGLHLVRGEAVLPWPEQGRVVHATLVDAGGPLDDVLVVGRERGVEIHVHGGPGVVERVLGASTDGHGGVVDNSGVCRPTSLRCARALLSARHGSLRRLRDDALAACAAGSCPAELRDRVETSLSLVPLADRFLTPARIRLVGPPNAGKSTLFNALLGRDRALTSPVSGTTRDTVSALMALRGVPVVLEDTAGVEGPLDVGQAPHPAVAVRLDRVAERSRLEGRVDVLEVMAQADRGIPEGWSGVAVSGISGFGIPELIDELAGHLGIPPEGPHDVLVPLEADLRADLEVCRRLA